MRLDRAVIVRVQARRVGPFFSGVEGGIVAKGKKKKQKSVFGFRSVVTSA